MSKEIQTVILAGGRGSRMQEVTQEVPKPMIKIGEKPIIWHIMKIYAYYGCTDFNLALGYKGEIIKEFFLNYKKYTSSLKVNTKSGKVNFFNDNIDDWNVSMIDTGLNAETGKRLLNMRPYLKKDSNFFFTYGDGVSDVNLEELYKFHIKHGKIATITSVNPPSRFGTLDIDHNQIVDKFAEKPEKNINKINGGFFVFNTKIFNYLTDDNNCIFEKEPLEQLVNDKELVAFDHGGFWQCMDTIKDCDQLNDKWNENKSEWKIW